MDSIESIFKPLQKLADAEFYLGLNDSSVVEPTAAAAMVAEGGDLDLLFQNRLAAAQILRTSNRPDELGSGGSVLYLTFAEKLHRSLHLRNQFVVITDRQRNICQKIFAQFFDELAGILETAPNRRQLQEEITELVRLHARRLKVYLDHLAETNADAGPKFLDRRFVCRDYSPELQAEILRLDVEDLPQPILDLGCGSDAALVKWLRGNGLDAIGIDPYAAPGPHSFKADWFASPQADASWGTIISHLGFSAHFLHHHYRDEQRAARYAERYMQLLQAIAPGGLFIYTPSLPFIEQLLDPQKYQIVRYPVEIADAADIPAAAEAGDDALFSATTIRVLAD